MTVIQFKPKEHSPEATRKAIEDELMRLAEKYGVYEVVTVATYVVATAIETVSAKDVPNAIGWAADLKARLVGACRTARRHRWIVDLKTCLARALKGTP